ncbi:MAG: 50S ribosomal protein L22 [Bacilli bacterium]
MAEEIKKVTKKAPAKKETTSKEVAPKKTVAKKVTKKADVKEAPKKEVKEVEKTTEVKVPAKKDSKKVEAKPAKPAVTEASAKSLSVKVTPRKLRLVVDLVRGKNCTEALGILSNVSHQNAGRIVMKVIKSAMANATNNFNMNEDKLFISNIQVGDSVKMRRFLPRAKGSASGMVKRFSNVFVTVKEKI